MAEDKLDLDNIKLSKVTFNSEKNLTELLNEDFLNKLNNEFEEMECINIVLHVSLGEEKPSKLIVLNHKTDSDVENKQINAECNTIGPNQDDDEIKKIINLLIK